MASLGKLKDSEYRDVMVCMDVPKVLLPSFFELDSVNFKFRKENRNAKTRFGYKNDNLVLFGKLNGENKFKEIK